MDSRTPVSVTHIGKYTVTIYDQEQYDESLRMYGDDNVRGISRSKFREDLKDDNVRGFREDTNDKPAFAKQKPAARWNWTHKLDQPLNVNQVKVHDPRENFPRQSDEMQLIRNFIEAREKQGHLFFWNDIAGFMHFPPQYGDTSCDSFIKKHKKAFYAFLQERKVKA